MSLSSDLSSIFYLSWCSWCPRSPWCSPPGRAHSGSPWCGTDSRCTRRCPAGTRWGTVPAPRSRCTYTSHRCCLSCSSPCHTGCSGGQCTLVCTCHTSGCSRQALENTESKAGMWHSCLQRPCAVGFDLWVLWDPDKNQQPPSIERSQILS